MRTRRRCVAFTLALSAVVAASPARAHDISSILRGHRDLPAVRRLVELHDRLHHLLTRYGALEREAGHRWVEVVDAQREVVLAAEVEQAAERDLADHVRTAYQLGPGGAIEAVLAATSLAELASIAEFTARTISLREEVLRDSVVAHATVVARRAQAEAARAALTPKLERLRDLMKVMKATVDRATDIARRAAVADDALEAQEAAVAAAAARMGTWDIIGYREDQSPLLALLGPTGGRTCDTPEGLVATGEAFEGYASWYGWEFGGQPTATGAIFDPRLFTAANRWLPFGTFLRVRHGDTCAIVLVNDRGPYGRMERVIDLSEAAANYLGVGVSWVRAEILVPSEPVS